MKVAFPFFFLACERGLGTLLAEQRPDLRVGDFANLMVVFDDLSVLIADTTVSGFHESVARLILGADVAVNAGPSVIAIARLGFGRAHGPVLVVAATEGPAY